MVCAFSELVLRDCLCFDLLLSVCSGCFGYGLCWHVLLTKGRRGQSLFLECGMKGRQVWVAMVCLGLFKFITWATRIELSYPLFCWWRPYFGLEIDHREGHHYAFGLDVQFAWNYSDRTDPWGLLESFLVSQEAALVALLPGLGTRVMTLVLFFIIQWLFCWILL